MYRVFRFFRSLAVTGAMALAAVIAFLSVPALIYAQTTSVSGNIGGDTSACIMYAPIVAVVVSILKKIPFVSRYPKIVAGLCSMIAVGFHTFATGGAIPTATLVACVMSLFAGSVATYEVAVKPVARFVSSPPNVPPSRAA